MPGKYQYDIELKSNVAKLLTDMKEVQDRLDTVEGKEYKIKLNVDEKKLSNVISNLEKMLDSLGKGTGDFKQFENLSKELSSIVSEVQNLSKAFGKVDDSGTKTLLSSIQNIDKSLSELSQHILNVNKNMSNIGSDTNGTVKQVENIGNAYDNAAKSAEKLADAQSKVGNKSNISSENSSLSQLNKEQEQLDEIAIKLQEIKEIENKIASKKELGEDFRMLKLDLDLAKQKLKDLTAVKLQEELKDILGTTDIWYRRVKSMSELLADTGGYFSNSLLSASSYFDVSDYRQQMIAGQIDTSKFFKLDAQGNQWNSLEKVFAESELGQKFKELGISVDEFIEKYHIRVDLGAKYTTEFVANVAKDLGYLGIIF